MTPVAAVDCWPSLADLWLARAALHGLSSQVVHHSSNQLVISTAHRMGRTDDQLITGMMHYHNRCSLTCSITTASLSLRASNTCDRRGWDSIVYPSTAGPVGPRGLRTSSPLSGNRHDGVTARLSAGKSFGPGGHGVG